MPGRAVAVGTCCCGCSAASPGTRSGSRLSWPTRCGVSARAILLSAFLWRYTKQRRFEEPLCDTAAPWEGAGSRSAKSKAAQAVASAQQEVEELKVCGDPPCPSSTRILQARATALHSMTP